jgi:OOP family OmpA-OmpF porin
VKQINKTGLSLAILLATTMIGSAAHAAEQSRFFVEAGVGVSSIDTDVNEPGVSVDDNDVFFSIGAGYNFNKMFAIEAGYIDLGEVKVSVPEIAYTATISADGFYFGPRLTFEITPQFEAYGRVGVFAWDAEAKDSVGNSASDDGTDVYFGIGAAYKISDQVSLGADWTRYAYEDDGDDFDVDTFGAKLKFNF